MSLGEEHATYWLCIDCMLLLANGEYTPDRPDTEPEPLSMIEPGDHLTLGSMTGEGECPHGDWHTLTDEEQEEHLTECDRDTFRWSSCDGCGSTLGGERHAATLWWTPKDGE